MHTYVGMFQNQDKAIIISMMGSKKMWADLRTLIEKGFTLEGKPIAELEPVEERLHFARNEMGNSIGADEPPARGPKRKGVTAGGGPRVAGKKVEFSGAAAELSHNS